MKKRKEKKRQGKEKKKREGDGGDEWRKEGDIDGQKGISTG